MTSSHNLLAVVGEGEEGTMCTHLAEEVGGPDSGLLQTNMVTSSDVLQQTREHWEKHLCVCVCVCVRVCVANYPDRKFISGNHNFRRWKT